jgi:8-oxo-dGTP diphosphatase
MTTPALPFGIGRHVLTDAPTGPPRPAAGILLNYTDGDGDWWLLGQRAPCLGGTWANLGGSLNTDEDPLAGALRELDEEVGLAAADLTGCRITGTHSTGTPAIPYTLFVLDTPRLFVDLLVSWEHDDVAWWHGGDVPSLPLHRRLASAWPSIRSPR